jgi:hypothetical protein
VMATLGHWVPQEGMEYLVSKVTRDFLDCLESKGHLATADPREARV